MPGTIDLIIAGLIAIAYPIWDHLSAWPRMLRTIASGQPNGRVLVYREVLALEWITSAVIAAVWIHAGRPWRLIGLVPPVGWRLALTLALLAALMMLFRAQLRAIRRLDAAKRDRVRIRQGAVSPLIARNRVERAWFVPVAITAGICEEFVYRGFLLWVFRPWLGLWGAALASTISFGFAHSYQGRAGAIRALTLGAVFVVIAIAMGSVVPGMALHALLDLIGGESAYAIFAEDLTSPAAA
jgi:membrane protease YdiL (CAAX protease family)